MCNCIYNKLATHIVTVSLIAFMTDGFHKNMHAVHKASVPSIASIIVSYIVRI